MPGFGFAGASRPPQIAAELRALTGATQQDLANVRGGVPFVATLPPGDKHEVATAGVVWAGASKECFLDRFEDIRHFIGKSQMVLDVGKFNDPPDPQDLQSLTLDSRDLDALRRCLIGDCAVKAPANMIEKFRRVNWSAPDAPALAQTLFRRELLDYAKSYLERGNPALAEYRDKSMPVSLADQFRSLRDASFASSRGLDGIAEFEGYLERYPQTPPPNLERFLYWSKLHLAFKAVITLSDVVIDRQPGQILIGSKQIYASHYLEGSLGLIAAVDAPNGARPGMYLVYVNRSRIDALDGAFGAIRRAIVQRRLREAFRKYLASAAKTLGSSCEAPKG